MKHSDTTARVLHLIEDATNEPGRAIPGCTIAEIVVIAEIGETTTRKIVKGLEADGFVRKNGAEGRHWRYVAVAKHDDEQREGVKNMTDTPTPKAGRPPSAATLARDEAALVHIKSKPEGATVEEIAEAIDTTRGLAYLSVWRLRHDGKVAKTATGNRTPRWTKV